VSIFKKIKDLSEVKEIIKKDGDSVPDNIIDVFRNFMASKKVQEFGRVKKRGVSSVNILLTLLLMGFNEIKSVRALFLSGLYKISSGEKDVYYRLKNNENIDWRKLLYSIAKRFIFLVDKYGNRDSIKKDKITAFVADDTVIAKTGEKIEHIGKVFDHTSHGMVVGFKQFQFSFWDGTNLLPLDFSFHSEKGKNKRRPYGFKASKLRKRYSKKRDHSSPGYVRERELIKPKTDMLIGMIKRAVKNGFRANYVLIDKWYFSEKLLSALKKMKNSAIHLLCPIKMDKKRFLYQGKEYTAKELLKKAKKSSKRSRRLNTRYIKLIVIYKGHKLCLFFNRSFHTKNWQLLATANLYLTFNEAMKIYGIRWTIEVSFKEMKQHFGLGRSQSQDFDAQIADTTISMIRYIMLVYIKRFRSYETIGGIFANVKQFMIEYNMAEKIWIILCEIIKSIADFFEMPLNDILRKIFENQRFKNSIFMLINSDYTKANEANAINNALF
jgi:hypothetical protein